SDLRKIEVLPRIAPVSLGIKVNPNLTPRKSETYMTQTSAAFRRDTQSLDGSISLSEIISALSYALDLTEGAVHGHALRSCLLGMRIAEEAKLPSEQTSSLYFA